MQVVMSEKGYILWTDLQGVRSLSPGGQLWLHTYRALQLQDCSLWLLREKTAFTIFATIIEHLNPNKILDLVEGSNPLCETTASTASQGMWEGGAAVNRGWCVARGLSESRTGKRELNSNQEGSRAGCSSPAYLDPLHSLN